MIANTTKRQLTTPLLQQIISELQFSGPDHFSLTCYVSILETLIRYSIQPSQKVFNHIKQTLDSLQQHPDIYAYNEKYQQGVMKFISIASQLSNNQQTIIQRFQSLHVYANHGCGLDKGMKWLIAMLFNKDSDTVNKILIESDEKRIGQILIGLSGYFKVKFIVLEGKEKKEYLSIEGEAPVLYLRYEIKQSSVLYTREMMEMESSNCFDPMRLEELPFMSRSTQNFMPNFSQGPFSGPSNKKCPNEINSGPCLNKDLIKSDPNIKLEKISKKCLNQVSIEKAENIELKLCYIPNCPNSPMYTCTCSKTQIGVCQFHLMSHLEIRKTIK